MGDVASESDHDIGKVFLRWGVVGERYLVGGEELG